MKFRVSLFLSFLFYVILNAEADSNHITLIQSEQAFNEEPSALTVFYIPIKFTQTGIRCFLKHAFNLPEYATDFLPYNFTHIIQFLEYGRKTEQSALYMQSIIRLFYNKLKATHFVTSYALHEFLEPLPDLLKKHCVQQLPEPFFCQLKNSLNNLFYQTFLKRFSFFKQNPDEFFNDLSENILTEINVTISENSLNHEQFRQSSIRLLEIALNKLIWHPSDGQDIWKSVKLFAQQLEKFYQADIIDEDELDDLYRSLLERFCYYLSLYGAGVSLETVEVIKKDIDSKKISFLELEEQETYLESKSKRLERAIMITEAKIHAQAQGIIT